MVRSAGILAARRAWLPALVILLSCSCSGTSGTERDAPRGRALPTGHASGSGGPAVACPASNGPADVQAPECAKAGECSERVPHYAQGRVVAQLCPAQAAQAGLTVIDLGDDWAPRILAGGADGPVPYRDTYVKLANERLGEGAAWYRAEQDRYYELYGVFPSLSVVRARLRDDPRHECHDRVDHSGLAVLDEGVDTWRPVIQQRSDMGYAQMLEGKLADAARRQVLPSIDALAHDPEWADTYRTYRRLETRKRAIREMQAHLRCDGLLTPGYLDGLLDTATVQAMQAYHRRHMIVSWQLDNETRQALMTDSRELDFRTALRVLRERIVDATGVIEDGSAIEQPGTVVGRLLDARAFLVDDRGDRPTELGESAAAAPVSSGPSYVGAPDWIASATDAAAQALGWWAPADARAFLEPASRPSRIAVQLPARPAYHDEHMVLRAEIDRGDVWYDYPFVPSGDRRLQPRARKPSLIVYAEHDGAEIALVRWPTTIGGWQPEKLDEGMFKLVYKESPPGPRIWRDIVAVPRWIPPSSTPRRDLWRPRQHGRWALKVDTFGPGYASAYGMVMMIHHRVDERPDGPPELTDYGVRSHGSVSYASILDGFSHGCHRLHNHRAMRLAGFLLEHRKHVVRGPMELDYYRTFRWRRLQQTVHFESRGYRYELTPPVAVNVLEGDIRGHAQRPLPPRPLTRPMWKRYNK